jgi:hypothetical protein
MRVPRVGQTLGETAGSGVVFADMEGVTGSDGQA